MKIMYTLPKNHTGIELSKTSKPVTDITLDPEMAMPQLPPVFLMVAAIKPGAAVFAAWRRVGSLVAAFPSHSLCLIYLSLN